MNLNFDASGTAVFMLPSSLHYQKDRSVRSVTKTSFLNNSERTYSFVEAPFKVLKLQMCVQLSCLSAISFKKKSQTWFSSNELAYLYLVDLFNAHYQCSLRIHWWPITSGVSQRAYYNVHIYQKAQFLYSVGRSACCPQRVNKLLLWASVSLLQWLKDWEKLGFKFGGVSR